MYVTSLKAQFNYTAILNAFLCASHWFYCMIRLVVTQCYVFSLFFGNLFVFFAFKGENKEIEDSTRRLVYFVLSSVCGVGVLLMFLLRSRPMSSVNHSVNTRWVGMLSQRCNIRVSAVQVLLVAVITRPLMDAVWEFKIVKCLHIYSLTVVFTYMYNFSVLMKTMLWFVSGAKPDPMDHWLPFVSIHPNVLYHKQNVTVKFLWSSQRLKL